MLAPPDFENLVQKVEEIITDSVDLKQPLVPGKPLMKELGLDSLDMIEISFSLEEFFGFEFSGKNALDELNAAIGGVVADGLLTPLGREMVFNRCPELVSIDLPDQLRPIELQQYYTLETFARLIHEFYLASPDFCPDTNEPVVCRDFKIVTAHSNTPVAAPGGDLLMDRWVETIAATLRER